jgi:RimJ/RimL family protein N-acetyltransferase
MPEREPVALDEQRALATLDTHHGMVLHTTPSDLRRPGWTLVAAAETDPVALLFGQRPVLTLIAPRIVAGPATSAGSGPAEAGKLNRAGVALVSAELRTPLAALLREWSPEALFSPEGRVALDALVRSTARGVLTPAADAHLFLHYAIPATFRPYLGQWLDWTEPLDESTEMEPTALSLLARYGDGVYVVRDGAAIVAYAGIRRQSPAIAELHVRTMVESLRGRGIGRAVASSATRAIFADGRIPLFPHPARDTAAARLASALGYRLYAEALIYAAALG